MTSSFAHILGKQIPPSALRPDAGEEIAQWGGPSFLRGKRVLDLGCGDGRLAIGASPYAADVVGVDPDPSMIQTATGKAKQLSLRNIRFDVGAAQELPLDDGAFDIVILSWTL